MPCFDPKSADEEKHAREGMAIACYFLDIMQRADGGASIRLLPLSTQVWWEAHKKRDDRYQLRECEVCRGSGVWCDSKGNEHPGCACEVCLGTGKVRA